MDRCSRFSTVWLSDLHLGSKNCRVERLLDFLNEVDCEHLYLVGDIIDIKRLRRGIYWPASHGEVLQKIVDMSKTGTRVTYIPGNHDDEFRKLCGMRFGDIEIVKNAIHTTANDRRLLILHGDEFDGVIKCGPLLAAFGSVAYGFLISMNRIVHGFNDLFNRPYWSLAANVKSRVRNAMHYVEKFKAACL